MKKKYIIIILVIIIISILGCFFLNIMNKKKLDYEIEEVSEYKYFVLKRNDKYGVIDKTGTTVIDTKFDRVEIPNPSKDMFICYKNENGIALNSNNQQMFTEYDSIEPIQLRNSATSIPYEKSTLKVQKNGKYGLITFNGEKILDIEYESIEGFPNIEGQLQVQKNGKFGVVTIVGTTIVKPEYDLIEGDNFYSEINKYREAGYIVGQKYEDGYKYGYVNNKGKLKLKLEYNDLSRVTEIPSNEGVYLIGAKNGQYGVISKYKNIIDSQYQSIQYDNSNNIFILQKNKNYGIANLSGKIVIPVENTNIQAKGKYIYVEKNNIRYVCNSSGEKVDMDFDKTIIPTSNEKYKIVITSNENGNFYGVIGDNDRQIIKSEYLYIEYAYDNYFIVCGKNGKLGVIDSNEDTKIELNYDLVQKVHEKNIIQTLSTDTNITELYSNSLEKFAEMENATLENQDNYIKIYSNNEIRYYDIDGKEISNTKLFPNNSLYASNKDNKWGFVDKNNNVKVDYEYDFANEINEYGFASIKKDGKWGCINSNGKIIVEPKYELNENNNKVSFIGEYIKIDSGSGNTFYTNEI